MELSIRMKAVADLVSPGLRIADVGTDHAYIPVYLVQHQIAPSAIAMDVRTGPLEHAVNNIHKYCLEDKIETRLSDGLEKLSEGEADALIIAGMGGLLMVRILTEGEHLLGSFKELILQPQSDIDAVRKFLHAHHFKIISENMVIDDGKYYTMMKAVHGEDVTYNETEYLYGKLLIDTAHPILKAYIQRESIQIKSIMDNLKKQNSDKSRNRLIQLDEADRALDELLKVLEEK